MKDKHRIYAANIIALVATWGIIYLGWRIMGNENCSGMHCLGYGPLLFISSLILFICSAIFSLRTKTTIPKCCKNNYISYICLIKRPLIITAFLSVVFTGLVTYNSIAPTNTHEWLLVFLFMIILCIPTISFLTVWYFIAGRHNKAI